MTDKNLDIKMENCSLTDSIEQNHEDKVVIEEEEENSIYKSATIADLNSPQPINSKIEKMSPGLAKRVSQSPEQFSPISNQISPNSASSSTSSSSSSANLKIQHALEKNMQKLNLVPKNKFVKNSNLTKEDIELFTANNVNDNEVISQFSPNHIRNSLSNTNSRNSANREMTPDSIDENYYVNTNPKPKKKNPNLVKPRVVNRVSQIGVSSSSTSSSISSNLSSPITNQQIAKKINKKQLIQQQQQQQHLEPLQFNRNNKNKQTQPRHLKQPIVQNNQLNTKQLIHKKKIQVKKNSVIHHHQQQQQNHLQKNIVYQDNDDDDEEEQSEFDDYNQEDNFEHDDELDEQEYEEEEDCDNENYQDYEDQQDEEEDFYEEDNENYENYHYEKNSKFMKQQAEKINSKLVKNINPLSPHNPKNFQNKKPISRPNTLITNNNSNKNNKPNVSQSAFIEPISNKNSLNTSASSSTSTIHSNQNIKLTTNTTTTTNTTSKSNNSYQSNQINSNNIQSNSDRDYDTDEETNKLLLEASKQQQQQQSSKLSNENSQTTEQCKNMIEAKQQKSRENQIHQIMDPDNQVLIEGVLFRARYLGSTQLVTDGNPTKLTRMLQAQEAVGRIKAPEGESQPSVEVDLFVSTEKIMVLNTDLQEIMMDHSLRSISYIADIGNLVVLMAKRRSASAEDGNTKRQVKMICHVFESEEAQLVAQSIGQAFQVAYMEYLKANGIEDMSIMKDLDYQEVLNQQEIMGDELLMFAKKECQKEVIVPKHKNEPLGVVIVESGWGSMLPTVVVANMMPTGPAARCGHLNIGDQIISVNGISMVGLPLTACQAQIKSAKHLTLVRLVVVPCPPVVEVLIKRPDTKYQLGFSVQDGIICSLLRGGIAERGGVRVGHRIIEINNQSVVATPHEKIVSILANSVGELRMKTMPTQMFRLLTGQELPVYI